MSILRWCLWLHQFILVRTVVLGNEVFRILLQEEIEEFGASLGYFFLEAANIVPCNQVLIEEY